MADLKINKPLYKDSDEPEYSPTPRPPKASIVGRAAALFLDIMVLRLLFSVLVRYMPEPILSLGPLAPWVGLLIGWAYFGVGFSHITLGRTFGKLILRVQVAETAGPDLPVGRAFLRAGVLLWPLPVLLGLRLLAESHANVDPTSVYTTVEVFGWMLILGWVAGNLLFAMFDPFGRSVHDRVADSIVINAELEPAPVQEFLAGARTAGKEPPLRKSAIGLGFALTLALAFAVVSSMEVRKQLGSLSPEELYRARAMVDPEFGRAWPVPPVDDVSSTETLPVTLNFRKRGHLDLDQVRNSDTTQTLQRVISATLSANFTEELREYLNSANYYRARRGEDPTSVPENLQFDIGYAEYADLFFAAEAHPRYTISRTIEMPTTVTEAIQSVRGVPAPAE